MTYDSYDLEAEAVTSLQRPKEGGNHRLMQAYCLKCRTQREMKSPKQITMKNGKPATEGICPTCGTRMFRIGKS
jgi:Domain of unknown function (DUF5679)